MDQAAQRVVSRSWIVSRLQSLRVGGPEHRAASGLLDCDLHPHERVDLRDHAIQVAVLGRDGHELSFSEGLEHPPRAYSADGGSVRVGFSPDRGMLSMVIRSAPARLEGWLWIALWIAVAVAEALALRPVLFDRDAPVQGIEVVFTLVGGSFAACGLIAWRRRPDSRSGLLMVTTGFLFFVSPLLGQLDGELANTLRVLFVDYWIFPFVTLILTFLTSGRLQARFDRLLVASYLIPLGIGQVAWMLTDPEEGHLLLAFPDADVAHAIDRVQRGMLVVCCLATVVVVVARWLASTRPRRRALLPSVAGAFALLCFATLLVNDLVSGTRSQTLLWIAACSLVSVPLAFLTGLLRSRLARGGLADLFRGLGATSTADLQAALRRALGDPSLELALEGFPTASAGRAVAPVERNGRQIAALVHDTSLDEDPELLEAACTATAVALENQRLLAEADARLEELKASRERIVAAGDAERRRLERNLHDGAQQRLVAIAQQLHLLQSRVGDDPDAAELVTTASAELAESLSELRELARGMHPAVLEHGLAAALNALANRSTVATTVSCETRERFAEPVELTAYFVASEALANVAKYSGASQATVRLWRAGGLAKIQIADDGIGGADGSRGSGLRGLADRVEALDGRLYVTSPPGAGTTVTAELPCG
jgi:signal transduction histidine kinase